MEWAFSPVPHLSAWVQFPALAVGSSFAPAHILEGSGDGSSIGDLEGSDDVTQVGDLSPGPTQLLQALGE